MHNQSTIAPQAQNIPAPQFNLFQKVHVLPAEKRYNNGCGGGVATIVGIRYVSFRTALKEHLAVGWEYTVDFLHDASEEEALQVIEPTGLFDASELTPVEDE